MSKTNSFVSIDVLDAAIFQYFAGARSRDRVRLLAKLRLVLNQAESADVDRLAEMTLPEVVECERDDELPPKKLVRIFQSHGASLKRAMILARCMQRLTTTERNTLDAISRNSMAEMMRGH